MNEHRNNIGVLRLVLASLVIIGHAPEMVDGSRIREPLTQIWPESSLGSLAVSGFFLLSGYLITQSMLRERNVRLYATRRLLRIVPAYFVAFILSFFVLSRSLGIYIRPWIGYALANMFALTALPEIATNLGLHYPSVNGALWTIAYEFRCYVLIAALWSLGILERRMTMLALLGLGLLATLSLGSYNVRHILSIPETYRLSDLLLGHLVSDIGFFTTFLVGANVYLFREYLMPKLGVPLVIVSLVLATIAFHSSYLSEFGRAFLLAAPIYWLAFKAKLGPVQRVNDTWDISYGTYLYGWPAATTLLVLYRGIGPWQLAAAGLAIAMVCGGISWFLIEQPTKHLARRWTKGSRGSAA